MVALQQTEVGSMDCKEGPSAGEDRAPLKRIHGKKAMNTWINSISASRKSRSEKWHDSRPSRSTPAIVGTGIKSLRTCAHLYICIELLGQVWDACIKLPRNQLI